MENTEITIPELEAEQELQAETVDSLPEEDIPSPTDIEQLAENVDISKNESDALREELDSLKRAMDERRSMEERAMRELDEFNRLYPEANVDTLDEGVWQRVRDGLPLSAAYAVFQREQELLLDLANQVNHRNASLSAGSAGAPPRQEYFSPDEVKGMSGEEVRQNYASIRRSMNYWRKAAK